MKKFMLSLAILMLLISCSKEADGGNDNSAASGQPEEFEPGDTIEL